MPRPSQIKWRLLPRLARSVGFAPVCGPQKLLAPNNYQQPHGTSRSGHHEKANSATRSESGPKFRHAANRVNVANKSLPHRYSVRTPKWHSLADAAETIGLRFWHTGSPTLRLR